ncbi:hypothetical protein MXB_584 [Myxobolus squamalis]|nr:hypothetical protein MXB_584 [Myxobolus squamalis]
MDLDTIRTKCSNNEYSNRSLFMKDVDLILNNCITYNGSNHIYTKMAEELHGHITKLIQKNSDNLAQFEKELSSKSGYHIPSQSPPKISPKSISSVPSLSVEQIEGIRDGSDDADLLDDLQLSQENSCDETF